MMCFRQGPPWLAAAVVAICVIAVVAIATVAGWWTFTLLCVAMMIGCMAMMVGMSRHGAGKGAADRAAHPFMRFCGVGRSDAQPRDRSKSADAQEARE